MSTSSPTHPPNLVSSPDRLSEQELAMVLSRFENWASTQAGAQPRKATARTRELSYDEALRVSRRRPAIPVPNLAAVKQTQRKPPAAQPAEIPKPAGEAAPGGAFLRELDEALKGLTPAPQETKAEAKQARPMAKSATVSVSVRMTAAERDILRADAAAESLTPAAYLLRSVSEVKVLRQQLRQALDTLKRCQESAPQLAEAPSESWMERLGRKLRISRRHRCIA